MEGRETKDCDLRREAFFSPPAPASPILLFLDKGEGCREGEAAPASSANAPWRDERDAEGGRREAAEGVFLKIEPLLKLRPRRFVNSRYLERKVSFLWSRT